MAEELLAQLIEEVGILSAERRRKEPRRVPRPYDRTSATPAQSARAATHGGLLTAAKAGRVRRGTP